MTSPLVNPAAGNITLSRLESSRSRPSMETGNRSGAILVLLRALGRGLVGTDAQEAREAQPAVRRAIAVPHLDHQLRIHPVGASRILPRNSAGRERRIPAGQGFQDGQQFLLGDGADAPADPAAECQAL